MNTQHLVSHSTVAPGTMQQLRMGTQREHHRIEQCSMMAETLQPSYTIEHYRTLLGRLFGFYSAIEPLIFADTPMHAEPVLSNRRKSTLLVRDLQALGVRASEIEALPRCFALPELKDFSSRMGSLYVMEGATLGGQIIRRRLIEQFESRHQSALNFYGAYDEHAGRQWRIFKDSMEQWFEGDIAASVSLLKAARETFNSLTKWLEQDT